MKKLRIANLNTTDLVAADRIYRLAFGTQFQLPDPMAFSGDANVLKARFGANPGGAWGAWQGDTLVGSCFASRWGSLGIIGPLTVTPERWGRGIAQMLLAATIAGLEAGGASDLVLATIPTSPGHLMLYRKFGFYPRFLYASMVKTVARTVSAAAFRGVQRFSHMERSAALESCGRLCGELLDGLDLGVEIESVFNQSIGETVVIDEGGDVAGFGICHFGPGGEAASGSCYLKFGTVRHGPGADHRFRELLDAASGLANAAGCHRLRAGGCYARPEAVEAMFDYGFSIEKTGVTMHRYNHVGYNREGVYLVDDWR